MYFFRQSLFGFPFLWYIMVLFRGNVMLITKEKETQFKEEMTELFKDKLVVQTQEGKYICDYWFCFQNKHLEEVSECCKKYGFKDYTVESADNFDDVPLESITKGTHSIVKINHILRGSAADGRVSLISNELGDVFDAEGVSSRINYEKRFSTFVVDAKYKDVIKPIVKKVLGINLEHLEFMDVALEDYDIDGLLWFTIDNSTPIKVSDSGAYPSYLRPDSESYPSYLLLCYLMECKIDHFIFDDAGGKLGINVHYRELEDNRKSEHGFRLDLNGNYRSSWEANLARILNYLQVPFEFEKQGFDVEFDSRGYYYLPDFFLSDNKIIEVKGFWNTDSRNKVKAFSETHPEYELLIIDGDMYTTLSQMYAKQIPQWEFDNVHFTKETLPVVGITLPKRRDFVKKLQIGDKVQLVREKDNDYDANAIKVLDSNNNHLGYIASAWAFIYASKMDVGMTFEAVVEKIEPKVLKIKVTRSNTEEIVVYDFLKEA